MYIKPTDSPNLLNRKAFAPPHLFKAIPYTQYRRATVICSTPELRDTQFNRITEKLVGNEYSINELVTPQKKAKDLDRFEILSNATLNTNSENAAPTDADANPIPLVVTVSFVTTYNYHAKHFRKFFNDHKAELNNLIGQHKIILSLKKNLNLGDVLFSGKKFANSRITSSAMNPCGTRCKTCPMLKMPRKINLENKTFTLYQQGSCKIEDTVYVYICNI